MPGRPTVNGATTPSPEPGMPARFAGPDDLETVTTIMALAFAEDPVWGPALPAELGPGLRTGIWRPYVASVMRLGWTRLTAGGEATTLWVTPGDLDLTPEAADAWTKLIVGGLGPAADRVLELLDRFEAAHPRLEPHYYLTLFGTHPDHRGRGFGMRLLADDLALIDAEGMPAYLESTNPANDTRYARVGFARIGAFEGHVPGSVVTTMWRPARR